jgi:rhodanese-related sulfurtransferase
MHPEPTPTPQEIVAPTLARNLKQQPNCLLLDVRHDWEFQQGSLPGAQHLPLGDLQSGKGPWPEDLNQPIVTFCHHGVRSAHAAACLMARGYTQVQSLQGGIDAWAREVDPSVGRY